MNIRLIKDTILCIFQPYEIYQLDHIYYIYNITRMIRITKNDQLIESEIFEQEQNDHVKVLISHDSSSNKSLLSNFMEDSLFIVQKQTNVTHKPAVHKTTLGYPCINFKSISLNLINFTNEILYGTLVKISLKGVNLNNETDEFITTTTSNSLPFNMNNHDHIILYIRCYTGMLVQVHIPAELSEKWLHIISLKYINQQIMIKYLQLISSLNTMRIQINGMQDFIKHYTLDKQVYVNNFNQSYFIFPVFKVTNQSIINFDEQIMNDDLSSSYIINPLSCIHINHLFKMNQQKIMNSSSTDQDQINTLIYASKQRINLIGWILYIIHHEQSMYQIYLSDYNDSNNSNSICIHLPYIYHHSIIRSLCYTGQLIYLKDLHLISNADSSFQLIADIYTDIYIQQDDNTLNGIKTNIDDTLYKSCSVFTFTLEVKQAPAAAAVATAAKQQVMKHQPKKV